MDLMVLFVDTGNFKPPQNGIWKKEREKNKTPNTFLQRNLTFDVLLLNLIL